MQTRSFSQYRSQSDSNKNPLAGRIQSRAWDNDWEKVPQPVQMKAVGESGLQADHDFEGQLNRSKGGGSPLPQEVRAFMEPRFGADFRGVRVHTGEESVQMSRAIGAQAFTHGSDVYFGAGKAPGNDALTAHELTHVVQQIHEPSLLEIPSLQCQSTQPSIKPSTKPPNKLVPLSKTSENGPKVSDSIVENFRAAAKEIQDATTVDLTQSLGDATRPMAAPTTKVGADNFSWHKTGRAIDINQHLKWVILEDQGPDGMQFRLFLEKKNSQKNDNKKIADSNEEIIGSNEKIFNPEDIKKIHHPKPPGKAIDKKIFVDVTQILFKHGFSRIPAHKGWEKKYDKREWWHYEKRDRKTMYQALKEIYTEEQIVSEYSKLATNSNKKVRDKNIRRLHREGFPNDILQRMFPSIDEATLACILKEGSIVQP